MPFLGVGKYKVVVSLKSDRTESELGSTEFAYFPTMNFAWILPSVLVAAGLFIDVRKHRKAHHAWWLAVPAFLGLTFYVLLPKSNPLGAIGLAQFGSLAILMGLLGICRSAQRWRCLGTGLVLNGVIMSLALWAAIGSLGELMEVSLVGSIISAVWFMPAAVAILLLRRRFTLQRYFSRMVLVWLILAVLFMSILSVVSGMPRFGELLMGLVTMFLLPLPFMIGLFLLLGFNPWCRRQFLVALGLEEMANELPPDFDLPGEFVQTRALKLTADGMNSDDDPWVIVEPPHEVDDQAEANTQKREESC